MIQTRQHLGNKWRGQDNIIALLTPAQMLLKSNICACHPLAALKLLLVMLNKLFKQLLGLNTIRKGISVDINVLMEIKLVVELLLKFILSWRWDWKGFEFFYDAKQEEKIIQGIMKRVFA